MPITVSSFIVPKNGNKWYVLEDTYLKGGLRVVANEEERLSIHPASRKARMLAIDIDTGLIWQLSADLVTWTSFKIDANSVAYTHLQPQAATTWTITHNKNCRYFTYSIWDSAGKTFIPGEITIVDTNTVTVDCLMAVAGHITLNFDLSST